MKRLCCALFIIVLIHLVCAATDTKPRIGRARYPIPTDFSNNNGRFEYEVTIVERVNRNGKRHSPHKHFIKYEHSGLRTGTVYYRLVAFGRTFNLRLERDDSYVSPQLTVEHVYSDARRLPFAGDLRHCFYRGDLHGDPNSTAVINLCNGLRGSFVSNGERYFVEPADEQKANASAHFRKFHIVFRHPTERKGLSSGPSTCGLKDTNVPLPLLRGRHAHLINKSEGGKRRRRSIDESFVETLIVADKTMVDAFESKADLQSYIITLMGVVSQVYRERGIGNPINIVVVKIAFLETNEPGLHISSEATRTLKSFCRWQKKVMAKDEKHPEHHDTAILLTKRNICRKIGKCDTLGLAQLGTMCNPSRSCALVEDSGLSTAYTIAHELGHVFSLPHDGDNNLCTRSRGDQHLMAPSLSFDTKPWSWSNCSRDKITQFLDLGYGSCLADKPSEKVGTKYQDQLPGEVFSVDKQCQMIFGEDSSLCPFMEPCRRLWCVKMIGRRRGCSTHHMPWADGTPCSRKRWCIRGQCVKKRRLKPMDGHWGQWGPYMECTRKCGGGISYSYRKCNNPMPENGGKYCIGQRKRFKSCNADECEEGSVDFRALQCVNTHARTVNAGSKSYRITQWVPKYAGVSKQNQCKLYCRMAGTAIYFKLKDKVIDGTPCNRETTDICVDGKCMPAGCDRVLNSDKKADKCGVCDGDNSSCRRFSGTFNETRFGYNYIFTIPVESTDIVITQYGWKNREDPNYLALQSNSGRFLLNGGMVIGLGVRIFRAAGSKIWYSGSEKPIEQIKIDGKTTEPIKVHVLEVGAVLPPNIHYALNQKVAEPKKFVYKWNQLGPWTQCSKLCQGQRKRRPRCVRAIDGQQVSNSRCDQSTRPSSVTEDCNISCRLRWHIHNPSNCSARCGPGYQTRVVRCMRGNSGRWGAVLDKHCPSNKKPPLVVPCVGTCEGTKWVYTAWTECSKSCNGGRQFRTADCVDTFGDSLNEQDCRPSDKQDLRRPCNTFMCPWWTTEKWSSCSVTCGTGQQTRVVNCKGELGAVNDTLCDQRKRPVATQSCVFESCPYWLAGEWTDCSTTCNNGTMTRQVLCLSGGVVARPVNEAKCSAVARPQSRKTCNIQDCVTTFYAIHQEGEVELDYQWRLKMWTPCSVSCGEKPGTQYRDVECVHMTGEQEVVSETHCAHTPKPAVMKECTVQLCTSWKHGSWGRCSRLCGKGVQLRVVKCTFNNFKITVDKHCDLKSKPLNIRDCKIRPCVPTPKVPTASFVQSAIRIRPTTTPVPTTSRVLPSWRTGAWGQCSVTCGIGQRRREVHCRYDDGGTSDECDENTRPQRVMDCVLRACPMWHGEPWSECSASCGQGVRARNVDCRFRNGQLSPGCDSKIKPTTKESCNIRLCPTWMTEEWGKCSVTCGSGVKQRSVECSDKDISCDISAKPQTTAPCNLEPCPQWKTSPWGECSVSCGEGVRQRDVNCRSPNDQSSPGCDEKNKPVTKEACNIRPCPTWITGDWDKCSVTCGSGVKQRSVQCSDKDLSCDARTKPQATVPCNLEPCPQWRTSRWRECSVSCGEGIRQRDVNCKSPNGQLSPGCNEKNKPVTKEACNIRPCPTWITGDWGKCSVTCGSGVKQRSVQCSDKDVSCDVRTKPQTTVSCNTEPCPQWRPSRWRECSVSCGEGIRQRDVNCRSPNGQLSPGCNEKNKPVTKEACNIKPCPTWITGDWGKCSVTCGSGVKQRSVQCSDKDVSCDVRTKPQTTVSCNTEPCPQWRSSSWGECSVSCGEGVRNRHVYCRLPNGQISPGCNEKNKSMTGEACNMRPCPTWTAGEWGKCSVTCGVGVKQRSVQCSDKDISCDAGTKPQTTASCNLQTCPQWTTTPWGHCSVSCGNGFRRRRVRCNGDSARCDYRSRPLSAERCNPGLCPTWKTGAWSRCSKTCGNGVKMRTVDCHGLNSQCDVDIKPVTRAHCNLGPCAEWKVGDWQQCSVTCGKGWRRRTVECTTRQLRCDYRTKPDMYVMCDMGRCPVWRAGLWSQCSVSCGNGLRKRTIECTGGQGKCNSRTQPQSTIKCNRGSCPVWKAGQWGQCSVTCGNGTKTRTVDCSGGRDTCDAGTKPQITTSCNLGSCPEWTVGDWSQCSVSCGNGLRKRTIECTGGQGKCNSRTQPQSTIKCNRGSCPVWKTGQWSQCSVTCANGTKTRTVDCSGGRDTCDAGTKPQITTSCNLGSCPEWTVGDWSQCSVTCGDGLKNRDVTCSRSDVTCEAGTKPQASSPCNLGSCPEWKVAEWGQCTVTCGNGFRRRAVECSGGRNKCDSRSKPEAISRCSPGSCPEWTTEEWSKCSVTCGNGVKERAVTCSRSDVTCDAANKPPSTAKCDLSACPTWEAGEWGQCSVTCGNGVKTRTVQCSGGSNTCDPVTRPTSSANCNSGSCPEWRAAPWSQCSASCGEGVKERLVECVGETGKSSACDAESKPADRASCNLGQCPHWTIGEWAECSVTCGTGLKQRKIECVSGVNASCDHRTKPVVTARCDLGPCPRWKTGRWTKCSRTCGAGIKRRAVGCFSMTTRRRLQDAACDFNQRPAAQLVCTVKECYPDAMWRKGEWGKCSLYCGIGDKTRDVWCSTKNKTRIPDEYCMGEHKPRMQRSCNKKRRCGEWEVGLWSECSATCGDGTRDRAIRCLHALEYKGDMFCDSKTRPSEKQECNKRACPALPNNYHWQTSSWSECSNSCGYGQKSRDIWCVDLSRRKVSDALCNPSSKPENTSFCYGSKCPSKWNHGDWSACSKSCARGYQYRAVECIGNTECNKRTKPPVWRPCNLGQCDGYLFWRVGPWEKCNVSCGRGIMRRTVKCVARNGSYVEDSFCASPISSKPKPSRVCQMKACPPTTCKEVQSVSGLQDDGEQTLLVGGKKLQVYCHAMMSEEPKEYITLKTGPADNFAEIYPKRLRDTRQCPASGSHFEQCDCDDEDYELSGGSYFSKVRIDLSAMRIIAEDKEFANTRGLNPPAYGTAGDCYSAQGKCPQGRFSINLTETGIRLTSKVMWGSTGQSYSQIIYRYPEGQQVIGKCGGRCGICRPKEDVGLKVELVEDVS